ncbi:MAG: dihydroneopterin aldolase [Candidatus Omnitrophica bacterium]|nr:dihydroneopterin aldolase [Candidatus Omnitrophota bacterium]
MKTTPKDHLLLVDLKLLCHLGITEEERVTAQPVWVDLEIPTDAAKIAQKDDVSFAIDYARVAARVKELSQSRSFRLMETLADQIANRVLKDFGVPWVFVRIKKKALADLGYAAVELRRLAA